MSEATTRQRRNLMLTTTALILISHAGLVFGEKLQLLGASVKITNPDMLLNFLLIAHVYFFWRFYQYFYVDSAYSALRSQYRNILSNKLDQVLMAYIFKSLPKGVSSISGAFKYDEVSRTDDSAGCYEVKVDYPTVREDEYLSEMINVPKKIFRFKGLPDMVNIFRTSRLSCFF